MRVLDLGCGPNKRPDATGVDVHTFPGVDVVWDLDRRPWPLDDLSWDLVIMHHVLEHLEDPLAVMREVHRIAAPGAEVDVVTPHFSSINSWEDPAHRHHFSLGTFDHFVRPMPGEKEPGLFYIIEKRLTFGGGIGPYIGRLLASLSMQGYERRAAFRYPARNIHVRLGVRKPGDAHRD